LTELKDELPVYLQQPSKLGQEISVTGKWVPTIKSGLFRKSAESQEMLREWEAIHQGARNHKGILSTEINHAIRQEALLVHHIFRDADSLLDHFNTTATEHMASLAAVAKPDMHLIRGLKISDKIRDTFSSKNVTGNFGEYLFGYVKNDYQRPDPEKSIEVTAKWTCKDNGTIEELIYWWQRVGKDAFDLEKGLVRFEVYRVIGENALIIQETFNTSDELQFHLSKGTAEKYKKNIDKIAIPENYFFRGPVSWMIRTYSKFLHLPATYSSKGSHYTQAGGTMSEGTF
tara:strand:+ start:651 stop:1511 length:861 start_codon:yes stop_codon:yes gene_type:complete